MKATTAKDLLNVTPTVGPVAGPSPQVKLTRVQESWRDSLEGVLLFCGIGLAVTAVSIVFRWLELPPPNF